jgi:hypothetical protein
MSWIIGTAVGYYAGWSGKKLADIFKGRRKESEKNLEKRMRMLMLTIIVRH